MAPVGGTGLVVLVATPDSAADALTSRLVGRMKTFLWIPIAPGVLLVSVLVLRQRALRKTDGRDDDATPKCEFIDRRRFRSQAGRHGCLRLHRGAVQPSSSSFSPGVRVPISYDREAPHSGRCVGGEHNR
jgi:hypothetical protein